jgi:hypothetical protein
MAKARLDRIEKLLAAAVARPVHVTINFTQGNVTTKSHGTFEAPTGEDESLTAVAPGAVGFRINDEEEEADD